MRNCDGNRPLSWNPPAKSSATLGIGRRGLPLVVAGIRRSSAMMIALWERARAGGSRRQSPRGCIRGAGRSWPSLIDFLEAAIAAPPRRKGRSSIFPGSLPCPGPTGIFAPAIDDHGATLTAPADLCRPISCSTPAHVCTPAIEMGWRDFMRGMDAGIKLAGRRGTAVQRSNS